MSNKSGTIFDYLEWRGDITFEQSDLNVIDALAFSALSYISFNMVVDSGINENNWITINDAYKQLKKLNTEYYCSCITKFDLYHEFFKKISASKRFRDIKVTYYVEKSNKNAAQQFTGMTFLLPDNRAMIAFRGTDLSIHGWQEDFNLAFMENTTGQSAAVEYVNTVASRLDRKLDIAGHSKGGNFAVWSAANMKDEYKEKVKHVYNFDGLGFTENFLKSDRFLDIEYKILSFIPEESIIGVLINHCDYIAIKSNNSSVMQHDLLSWSVTGKRFVYRPDRTAAGIKMEKKIAKIMNGLSAEEKAAVTRELFEILEEKNIQTLKELKIYFGKNFLYVIPKIVYSIINFKKNIRKKISRDNIKKNIRKKFSEHGIKINVRRKKLRRNIYY